MKKISSILFFLLALVTFFHSGAQEGFIPGYIVSNKGDTIKGKIKDRKFPNSVTSWQKIDFIDSTKNYVYTPEEIKEYSRKGKKRYVTLTIGVEAQKTFLEVSEEGPVILYSCYRGTWGGAGNAIILRSDKKRPESKNAFYTGIKDLYIPVPLNDSKERVECFLQFKNKPASLMQWRPRDYKGTAKQFFGDNEEIIKLIGNETLDESDIYAIVRKYNQSKTQ